MFSPVLDSARGEGNISTQLLDLFKRGLRGVLEEDSFGASARFQPLAPRGLSAIAKPAFGFPTTSVRRKKTEVVNIEVVNIL